MTTPDLRLFFRGFLSVTVVAVMVMGIASNSMASAARYVVTVSDPAPTEILVEAEFELESDVIGMYITASPQLENGTADLVTSITATDKSGAALSIENLGSGDWKIPGTQAGQIVQVSYRIRLDHGDYAWGPGVDEVAYRTKEGLFFTGQALFIVPGQGMPGGAEVVFNLPPDWKASLPWLVEENRARVPSMMNLVRNCFFLGTHHEEVVRFGDFTFVIVIGDDLVDDRQLLVDVMAPVLPAAQAIFGGMPRGNRYLAVFNRFGDRSDGGAFEASYSMLIHGPFNDLSSVIWGHGVVHEVLHFWNGLTIIPSSTNEEWFKEGVTDYLTILIRSRAGMDSRERVYRKLENSIRRYLLSKMMLGVEGSLREAGSDKHKKRMLVYGGGTMVAFVLDIRIRQATDNAKGIEDLLAALYAEFHEAPATYDLEDIIRLASEISGNDQREFFTMFVDGTELLDPAPYVRAIGLQLDTMADEFYLGELPGATAGERAMAVAILGALDGNE